MRRKNFLRELLIGIVLWGGFWVLFFLPKMAFAVVDIADPYHPREVGFYIPDPVGKGKARGQRVIQTNDADLDYRGLIYLTDRNGNGMHVLQFTK